MSRLLTDVQSFGDVMGGNNGQSIASLVANSPEQMIIAPGFGDLTGAQYSRDLIDPTHSKIVLGYIDATEATAGFNSSLYTNGVAPAWFGNKSPYYGIQSVQYWNPAWLSEVYKEIDGVISQGYDGVMLDVLYGDSEWSVNNVYGNAVNPNATSELATLLSSIVNYVNSKHLDHPFYLVGANPDGIARQDPSSITRLSGIFTDGLYYNVNTPGVYDGFNASQYKSLLQIYNNSGLPVFGEDYPPAGDVNAAFQAFSYYSAIGWVPSINPGTQNASFLGTGPFMFMATSGAATVTGAPNFVNFLSGGLTPAATLIGGNKGDYFIGGPGTNLIQGGAGNDTIYAHPATAGLKNVLEFSFVGGGVNPKTTPSIEILINGTVVLPFTDITQNYYTVGYSNQVLDINASTYGKIQTVEIITKNLYYTNSNDFSNLYLKELSYNGKDVDLSGATLKTNTSYEIKNNDILFNVGGGLNFSSSPFATSSPYLLNTSDIIDGGAGTNVVIYRGSSDGYKIVSRGDGALIVSSSATAEGPDTLTNIQQIVFTDRTIATFNAAVIVDGYESFFHRAPTAAELGVWSSALSSGTTVAAFNKVLANDATGKANEPALVKYLYDGYFGRDPSSSETTYWSGALQSGAASLASLNTTLANDGAGKANAYLSIKGLYDVYLGRDPGVSEVSYWSGALKAGTYDLRGFELVLAAQAGASANAAAYVTQAYKTWLGHAPSTSDLSYWTGQFNDGALTPLQLRQALINDASGQAYISSVITADYTADFGRAATSAEITTWKGLIANGAGFVTLTSALLGDGGGTTARTITATYDSYFGRDPTNSEMAVWRGMLTSGTTQASMRATLVNDASGQAHTVSEVGTLYQEYFGRAATTSEVNVWKGLVANGSTFVQLHDALIGDASGKAYAAAEISPLYQAIEGRAASTAEVNYWTGVFNSGASNLDTFVDTLLRDGGSKIVPTTVASGHAATTFVDVLDTLVINGFAAGDQVNFHGAVFDSYNPLDHAVQVNGDVLIYGPDATHFVLLENIQLANLTAANFMHV